MNPNRIFHPFASRQLFLFLCFCWATAVFSQPAPFYFREIPLPEQARHAASFCMEMDEEGFMWLGSTQGLLRFDGSSLTPPHGRQVAAGFMPPVRVQVMLKSKTRPNTLWLGTLEQGLCCFNTVTQEAWNYRFETNNLASLGGDAVAGLAEDADGTLWVGSDNFTLNKLAAGQSGSEHFTPPPPPGKQAERSDWLGEIVPDVKNPDTLWIGSRFGVYRFDKNKREFKLFPFEKTEDFWYIQHSLQLFMDGEGILWAGGLRSGLLRLDPGTGKWENWKRWENAPDNLNANTVYEIQPLDADRLLIAVSREGLWWFDKKKKVLSWLPEAKPVWGFAKILPGMGGGPRFLLSTNDGLTMMTAEPFVFPYFSFQQNNPVLTEYNWQRSYLLSPGKDTLYLGTMHGDGLLVLDLNTKKVSALRYRTGGRQPGTDVLFDELCLDETGKLWMGTDEGLLFLNKKTAVLAGWRIQPFRAAGSDSLVFDKKHVQALACREGWLWAGVKNEGLYRIRLTDGKTEHLLPNADGLPGNHIRKIYVDKTNRLWAGSDAGLSLFDPASGFFSKIASITGAVTDIELDSAGQLWLGTLGNGLQRLDFRKPAAEQLTVFQNDGALGADLIFDVKTARDGRVWLHTQGGLAILDPATGYFINYDMRDNVASKLGPLEELLNGTMVSAGRLGCYFLPAGFGKDSPGRLPKPYLKSLRLLHSEKSRALPFDAPVELASDENQLAFELGAVWLDANPAVYFEYKLEGFDSDWVFAGSRSFVSYNSLPPGKYRFTFRAGSRPGLWSPPTEAVGVVIRPAFYQTVWFKVLILLVLAGLLWGAYQLRMRRVRREERMQAAFERRLAEVRHDALRAQMNPHFLSNCLNAIQWFIIKNRPNEAFDYLTKFSRLVRSVLDQSQRQRITLAEEIGTLRLYLDMESIRFENEFEIHLQIDEHLDQQAVQIPPMLLQPLVENAIRHGLLPAGRPGSNLTISIAGNGDALTCTVEDNGIGRAASADLKDKAFDASPSQGFKLTSERLTMMNGVTSLVFHDLFDENGDPSGTKVVLTLPLEK